MKRSLLFADDDAKILLNCFGKILEEVGPFEIDSATTPKAVMSKVEKSKYDFILLDVSFSPGNREGLGLISEIKSVSPETNIIMLTSHSDSATIAKCMGLGVSDFLGKNDFTEASEIKEKLSRILERAHEENSQRDGGLKLAKSVGASFTSRVMKEIYAKIFAIKNECRMHVLITGETGVGKELIAKAISNAEIGAPFYPINSSCFGKDLLESELFGSEKGAFTGADKQKLGLFELANNGVLFLDEVATLTLDHQAKLLRVLQNGEFYRLGGTKLLKTTARVVTATNEDLASMVKKGTFREDLLQRLERHRLHIPPLRERKEDIICVVESTIKSSNKPNIDVGPNVMQVLEDYDWPRNVRQLEDTILSAIVSSDGKILMLGDLPKQFFSSENYPQANQDCNKSQFKSMSEYLALPIDDAKHRFEGNFLVTFISTLTTPATYESLAAKLGMTKTTLQRALKNHGIDFKSKNRKLVRSKEILSNES